VLDALRPANSFDFIGVATHEVLSRFLAGRGADLESLCFSDLVVKINRHGQAQFRHLILTNKTLYNFVPWKYESCQREIPLDTIEGIVLSSNSNQIVFKVSGEYDYHYKIIKRKELCKSIHRLRSRKPIVFLLVEEADLFVAAARNSKEAQATSIMELVSASTTGKKHLTDSFPKRSFFWHRKPLEAPSLTRKSVAVVRGLISSSS